MMIKFKFFIAALALVAIHLILLSQLSAANNEKDGERTKGGDNDAKNPKRLLGILDWDSYMRIFNKRYSSFVQQLARQKLFLARAMQVFLTSIKYKMGQLSYYRAINKYSDLTPEESARMLGGDITAKSTETEQMIDDEEAEKIFLEAIENRENERGDSLTVKRGQARASMKQRRSFRTKRSTTGTGGGRGLSGADLVRLPDKVGERDPNLKIKWVVPSNNPDYEPIETIGLGVRHHENKIADDIPEDTINGIVSAEESSKLASLGPANTFSTMKNAVSGAIGWMSAPWDERKHEITETVVMKDWRQSGCVNPARDQGDCLSCYAIVTTSFIEWAHCMSSQDNEITPLSVQYVIDCGPQYSAETGGKIDLDGCSAGITRDALDFFQEYGAELEANMPYIGEETECPVTPNAPRKKKGYIRPNFNRTIRLSSTTKKLDLALKVSPVIVSMFEPKDLIDYEGGMVEECHPRGGHAMLIVGHAIEDGVEYLLIQNTFGSDWGYDGYLKFKRSGVEKCVKELIVPMVYFPSRKSQARRIKAYLSHLKTGDDIDIVVDSGDMFAQV